MNTLKLEIEIRLTTRKIVNLTDKYKGKNLGELYFKASNNCNEKFISEFIFAFAEKDGKTPFNGDINQVYDFLDNYMKENKKSYKDIYNDIAEIINEEGFFSKKMTKEELTEALNNPMASINMEETMKNVVDKIATEVASEEFKGYKG